MAITTASAQGASYGAKLGLNFANINSDDGVDYSNRTAFALGLTSEFKFNPKNSLGVELIYSGQGNKEKEEGFGGDDMSTVQALSYLNIPILYNYYVMEGLAVKIGLQPGVLLSGKKTETGGDAVDVKDDFTPLDISLPIGVSYEVYPNVTVDMRYNLGLTNDTENIDSSAQKHTVFQITVGYRLK